MTDENNMDVPSEDLTPEESGPPSDVPGTPADEAADAPAGDAPSVGPDLSASLLEDPEPVAVESEEEAESAGDAESEGDASPEFEKPAPGPDDVPEEDAEAAMLEMLDGLPDDADKATPDDINFSASASKAEFQHLQQPAASPDVQNIELLMDVDLPVSIELGRTKMNISSILALGPGSVVELNKLAGEPVDLLVNSKVVAKGEVVVVDESFGLRITQLMTPEERLKALAQE